LRNRSGQRSVMESPTLRWPERFRNEPNVRTLADTSDLLKVLPARP
jgi:hypothetical protein